MIVLFSEGESFEGIDDLGLWWREGVEGEGRKDCWSAIKGSQVLSLLLSISRSSGRGGRIFIPPFGWRLVSKVLAFSFLSLISRWSIRETKKMSE
jgi:hypothetical protein